jgi:hypothetical protein
MNPPAFLFYFFFAPHFPWGSLPDLGHIRNEDEITGTSLSVQAQSAPRQSGPLGYGQVDLGSESATSLEPVPFSTGTYNFTCKESGD